MSLFLSLSLLIVLCLGAANISGDFFPDHLIYGRYTDGIILPLLTIGFLALTQWQKKLKIKFFAVSTAALLLLYMGLHVHLKLNLSNWPSNLVSTAAFYPQYLVHNVSLPKWMLIGFAGVLIVTFLGKYSALILMFGSFIITTNAQLKWNKLLSGATKPPAILEFIKINFLPGTCIGFDDTIPNGQEGYNYKLFYFYNYAFRRISINKWRSDCNGPLLTSIPSNLQGVPQNL